MMSRRQAKEGWIEHDGAGMPVTGETVVCVKFRDGEIDMDAEEACAWGVGDTSSNWSHEIETSHDIVAYRVVSA
jgi:hypothetical protein